MRILVFLLFIWCNSLYAQDLYLKNFSESAQIDARSAVAAAPKGGIMHITQLSNQGLLLRRINKCGDVIWAKEIEHDTEPLDVNDIRIDGNGNVVCSGNVGQFNNGGRPFIMSVSYEGKVNYLKSINTYVKVETIAYSFLKNKENGFYLYFNYGTGGTSLGQISVTRFDNDGKLIWFKNFPGMRNWGRAISTNDGGLLFRAGSSFAKMDSSGAIEWSKSYQSLGRVDYPVQVKGGYILFKYPYGSANKTTNLIKVDNQGKVLWVSNDFVGLTPGRGILRRNGNVLFTGSNKGVALIELDSATGAIINYKKIGSQLSGQSIFEDEEENILISGQDYSGIVGNISLYLKVDSSLNLPNCTGLDLSISNIKTPSIIASDITVTVNDNPINGLTLKNESYTVTDQSKRSFTEVCGYTKDRGILELGKDTILCPNQTLVLGSDSTFFDEYLWSTDEKTKQITISSSGKYFIEVIAACDTLRDTIQVSYYPKVEFFIGEDSIICNGDSIRLKSNIGLSNYLWSTGETSSEITVRNPGIYRLSTLTNCGEVRDSISISFRKRSNILELGNDTTICPNNEIILGDPLSDFDQFTWQDGQTTQFITVNNPGLYVVEATTLCDTLVDGINISVAPELTAKFELEKTTIKTFESIELLNESKDEILAEWTMGDGGKLTADTLSYFYKIPGTYTIRLTIYSKEGCEFYTERQILVEPSEYIIPNVFSPNNDGINDEFKPIGKDIKGFEIKIYDRWGKEIIDLKNIAWNGRNQDGNKIENGSYYYVLNIIWNNGGQSKFNGNVSLVD